MSEFYCKLWDRWALCQFLYSSPTSDFTDIDNIKIEQGCPRYFKAYFAYWGQYHVSQILQKHRTNYTVQHKPHITVIIPSRTLQLFAINVTCTDKEVGPLCDMFVSLWPAEVIIHRGWHLLLRCLWFFFFVEIKFYDWQRKKKNLLLRWTTAAVYRWAEDQRTCSTTDWICLSHLTL